MKFKLFFLIAFFAVTGCDKIKENATLPISTHISTTIPVVVTSTGVKSSDIVTVDAPMSFSRTQELKIEDNEDVAQYLTRIKEIELKSLLVTVNGLTEGQAINSISVDIAGIGNIFTQTNITMTNNSFTPTLAAGIFDSISEKFQTEKKITITAYGSTSGPLSVTVLLDMDAKFTVYLLK
jgi:hypothetical protein